MKELVKFLIWKNCAGKVFTFSWNISPAVTLFWPLYTAYMQNCSTWWSQGMQGLSSTQYKYHQINIVSSLFMFDVYNSSLLHFDSTPLPPDMQNPCSVYLAFMQLAGQCSDHQLHDHSAVLTNHITKTIISDNTKTKTSQCLPCPILCHFLR